MAKSAMLIDYKYCTGCHSCEVTCRNEKGISLDEWGVKVTEIGPAQFSDGKWEYEFLPVFSHLCDLCEERRAAGDIAPCTLHCLAQCMEIVPLEELGAKMAELGDTVACFIPKA